MRISKWPILATLTGILIAGSACTQMAADPTTNRAGEASQAVDTALDATKEGVGKAVDATAAGATAVIDGSKDVASATGEAITDGWITTKVSAQFVGEPLLKGIDINVDTNNHVVTLKGAVGSEAAKARATAIARDTAGVTHVDNQLVVTG